MSTPVLSKETARPAGFEPAFAKPIRFMSPTLPPITKVLAAYARSYRAGLITNSTLVERLESLVAERLEVRHCVAVSSCTSGLMLLLRCLDLEGEVIIPSLTFFATAHALAWNRLRPVFADCDRQTWNVSPADVAAKITERTSAIVGVHLYGNPCDTTALSKLASQYGLKLVFDGAHAFGSRLQGRLVGGCGDAEVFSLSPTKTLVAGEGGLITTNDATLARRLKAARNYGDAGTYDPETIGLNARMSEFHAALALSGLDLVRAKVLRHNRIADLYNSVLLQAGFEIPALAHGDTSTFKDYCVRVDPSKGYARDTLAAKLKEHNIETRRYFYPPVHRQKLYREYMQPGVTLPETDRISDNVLSLPIYESMDDNTVLTIAETLRSLAASAAGSMQTTYPS